jgi:hypothetical protein
LRQLLSLLSYQEANKRAMAKGFLMIGGTTDLKKTMQAGTPAI